MTLQEDPVRILVVDDEEKMTSFIASYLANEGYEVRGTGVCLPFAGQALFY